jgi:endonuclease/exonuclease/phosphatase family metal-dependent hydrolase
MPQETICQIACPQIAPPFANPQTGHLMDALAEALGVRRDSPIRESRAGYKFPPRFPALAVNHIFVHAALHPTQLSVHCTLLACLASDHFPLVCELTLI